jgi:hypothetical protein
MRFIVHQERDAAPLGSSKLCTTNKVIETAGDK